MSRLRVVLPSMLLAASVLVLLPAPALAVAPANDNLANARNIANLPAYQSITRALC